MRPLGSSAHAWPPFAKLAWLVFVCSLGGNAPAAACVPAPCFDLTGENAMADLRFSPFNYTNSSPDTSPTLTSTGPSSTYSFVIVDGVGVPTATIGLTQDSTTGGTLTLTGANTYSGPTTVQAGTLRGGAANAFSAASATTILAGGTLDLGGLTQTINTVTLAGGVIQNGALRSANGIISTGGALNSVSVTTSASAGNALTAGLGSRVNLGGSNTFTTLGANAIGLAAMKGAVITATGSTTVTTSGRGAFGLLASAGSISVTGTLNITTADPSAAAVGLQGNGASIAATGGGTIAATGNAIEFLGGTDQNATFDNLDVSTLSGDLVFADPSVATITFNKSVVNAGTGYLLDATAGSIITLNASASSLTGAMRVDATSTTNVNLIKGTVWNLTGSSVVSNLAVTNSVIVFAPPGSGGAFKTLTVNNYAGPGANIVLNTALGGSGSPTDQIIVNGGSATGLTLLTIRNAGGLGGLTTGAGIPIVTTTKGGTTAADAFALASTPIADGYRYALVDEGGDWYLVSSPTTTLAEVQSSINSVANARLGQIVTNNLLGSILLGATQQISCSNCASGFGTLGSFAMGTQGRVALTDRLTAIGGVSYNQWNSSGISVYDAPILGAGLVYDFDNWGSSRPFVEAGGWVTPYENVHTFRAYPNGSTPASGSSTAVDRDLYLSARAGWLARLTPIDEAAAYADLGRNWLQAGGYTEAANPTNPFPAMAPGGLQTLNIARLGGQYTHLFADNIEVNVSGAVAHGFDGGRATTVNVLDFGPVAPNALPNTTWFEYGARVGYRFSDRVVADAFVLGTAGGDVGATVHGGVAVRVAF